MADKDDDSMRQRRDRERKREEEDADDAKRASVKPKARMKPGGEFTESGNKSPAEHLQDLMNRAEPLIDQVNGLYNTYFAGAERRPPIERRKQLDQLMVTITMLGKPTAGLLFKASNIINTYATYRDRWDRILRDMEEGKGPHKRKI